MSSEQAEPREWLIRKAGLYYRPKRAGYTSSKSEAGRYTKVEAEREAAIEPWHMTAIHQDELPDEPTIAALKERNRTLESTVSEQAAEIARLTAEVSNQSRLRGIAEGKLATSEMAGVVEGWQHKCAEQAAEIERLREALEKIASGEHEVRSPYESDGSTIVVDPPVDVLQDIARTALQGREKNDG